MLHLDCDGYFHKETLFYLPIIELITNRRVHLHIL